jgi:hypothetical protein
MVTRTKAQAEKLFREQQTQREAERIVEQERQRQQDLLFADTAPDAFSKLYAWTSSAGDDDSIGIYRQLPEKKEALVCKIPVVEFDPETIKARFGGGTYIIKGYDHNNQIEVKQFITIEGEPIFETAKPVLSLAAPAPAPSPSLDIEQLLQRNNEKMIALFAANMPKPKTTLEMMQEAQMWKTILAPAPVAAADHGTPSLELIKFFMEMGKAQGGGDSDAMWPMKVLEMFGKPIADAWLASKTVPALAAPVQAKLSAPAATAAQPVEEENGMNLMIKGYIKLLGNGAEQNHPVEGYAEDIADHITPEFEAQLRAQNWQAQLSKYTNAVTVYPDWFARLREMVIAYRDDDLAGATRLTGDGAGDKVAGHENGDTAKPSDNGNSGGNT